MKYLFDHWENLEKEIADKYISIFWNMTAQSFLSLDGQTKRSSPPQAKNS